MNSHLVGATHIRSQEEHRHQIFIVTVSSRVREKERSRQKNPHRKFLR
jgi:hypothetical protein